MGLVCTCNRQIKDRDVQFDTHRINELTKTLEKGNYIQLIQARVRGIRMRAKFSEQYKFKLLKNNNSSLYKYSSIYSTNIQDIFLKYPLIDVFNPMHLELKPPFEYDTKKEIYYGEWSSTPKKRCGRGVQQWLDGSRYEGYWMNDKANIKGKLIHANGDTYEGEWVNDKANGFGLYLHKGGEYYEGEWKEDKQHGKGKETWPDGSSYIGDYNNGKRQGSGLFKWIDASEYEGNFMENMLHGKGKYLWNDKREFIGEWKYNQMNGYGLFRWPDGRRYEGEYKKDKKEGFGTFFWPDGRIFKGNWVNGKQHGEGEFYDPKEQNWKKGRWEYGKKTQFYG